MTSAVYASPHKAEIYAGADIATDLRNLLRGEMNQKELAAALGVSDAYVSDMLRGRRNMTPKFLNGVLDIVKVVPAIRQSMNLQAAREAGWMV